MSKEEREKPNKNLGFHHHEKDYDDEKHIDEVKHVHPDYYKRGNKDKVHHAKPPRYINKNSPNNPSNQEGTKKEDESKKPTRSLTNRELYKQERSFSRNKAMRKMQNENNQNGNRANARSNNRLQKAQGTNKQLNHKKEDNNSNN